MTEKEFEYIDKWINTIVSLSEWKQFKNIDHWYFIEQYDLNEQEIENIEEHQTSLYFDAVKIVVKNKIEKYTSYKNAKDIFKQHLKIINNYINNFEYHLILNELLNTIIKIRKEDYSPVLIKYQSLIANEFTNVKEDFNIAQEEGKFSDGHYYTANILFNYRCEILKILEEKCEYNLPPQQNIKQKNKLSDIITHEKSTVIVEGIKIQYRNIKGKSLRLLLKAFQDLDLLPKERIASKFYKACKNDFNWSIASYNAMNGYDYNDVTDKEELEQKISYLKSIIETK